MLIVAVIVETEVPPEFESADLEPPLDAPWRHGVERAAKRIVLVRWHSGDYFGQERPLGLHDLRSPLQHVASRVALLDLAADRVSQRLFRQLAVGPLVGAPGSERIIDSCAWLLGIGRAGRTRRQNK